jgi:diphthine-ammonia ligase
MCGIIGLFNVPGAETMIATGLKIIENRGKDGSGIYGSGENFLGHRLHSIISTVKQPLLGKGVLVVNCEIYNWKELNEKYSLGAENDAEMLLKLFDSEGVVLDELDGVYAFAYWTDNKVYVGRDLIGVKPVWFSKTNGFVFASENKALDAMGFSDGVELNPRKLIVYNLENDKIEYVDRTFFDVEPVWNLKLEKIHEDVEELLLSSIKKRIPDKKFGLLFSGGIDSTFLAFVFKKLGCDFKCYTAVLEDPLKKEPEDLVYSKKIAESLGLNLEVVSLNIDNVPKYLEKIVPLIEDSNVVKVGVGLTFYVACEKAKEDGCKVIFSGLGSEEIFAGYNRHKNSININKECLAGLRKIYERDLYRDDVITMFNQLELRVPFLDKKLVEYALKIDPSFKLVDGKEKVVLRQVAEKMGLDKDFVWRPKKAAQYGSNFDKAIASLTKRAGLKYKSDYLRSFYPKHNLKLGVLFSSGKDSVLAAYVMKKQNYAIECLITLKSKNPSSYMFHTPNIDLVDLQAQSMGLPLLKFETEGVKEKELDDLKEAIVLAKEKYNLDGIVTGALYSNYQRDRIEKICDELGLKIFSPLWHIDQELEMRQLIDLGFEVILSSVAADGLDKSFLGRQLTHEDVDYLVDLNKKNGINIAGEGGEFESLVLGGPLFNNSITIIDSDIEMENEYTGFFKIKKAKLDEV